MATWTSISRTTSHGQNFAASSSQCLGSGASGDEPGTNPSGYGSNRFSRCVAARGPVWCAWHVSTAGTASSSHGSKRASLSGL